MKLKVTPKVEQSATQTEAAHGRAIYIYIYMHNIFIYTHIKVCVYIYIGTHTYIYTHVMCISQIVASPSSILTSPHPLTRVQAWDVPGSQRLPDVKPQSQGLYEQVPEEFGFLAPAFGYCTCISTISTKTRRPYARPTCVFRLAPLHDISSQDCCCRTPPQ